MGYPPQWREFYERHLLPREGGYVPGTGTLLGVLPRVWVEAIPNIPQAEIDAQPEWSRTRLEAIRHASPGQRAHMVTEWINGVTRHLEPWGNGSGHTFERPRKGGNEAIVNGAHNLAFSVFYREYIRDTGIEAMQVEPRTQETISDSCIRYGEGYAYSLLARAIVSSGIRTEGQLNAALVQALDHAPLPKIKDKEDRESLGYVPTTEIANSRTYRFPEAGYPYTTEVGRRAVASMLHDLTPHQQDVLFDEFGKWRRTFDMNKPQQYEREGDMARTAALHGTYAEYDARRKARGVMAGATGATPSIGDREPADVQAAYAFTVMKGDVLHVAVEPWQGQGVFQYTVSERQGTTSKGEAGTVYSIDQVINLPASMELVRPGQRSQRGGNIVNPYSEAVVLVHQVAGGRFETFTIGQSFNELAVPMGLHNNAGLFNTNRSWHTDEGLGLDPLKSAHVAFQGKMGEQMYWRDAADDAPQPPSSHITVNLSQSSAPERKR